MKLKELRILPICATPCSENELYNWLCLDRRTYKIMIDRENPEYILVCISYIVCHRELFRRFREFYSDDRVVIYLGEEAISPDMNLFDYAITYDDQFLIGDRICRRPTVLWIRGGDILLLKGTYWIMQSRSMRKENSAVLYIPILCRHTKGMICSGC